MGDALSSTVLSRIQAAQRVLLSPLCYDSLNAWQTEVTEHVQTVMGADHAYAYVPEGDDLVVAGSNLDVTFFDGLRRYFEKAKAGALLLGDPMPIRMHRKRIRGGPGVYHELHTLPRSAIEAAPTYQSLFAPHGVRYTTGLSVPLSDGEAALCLAFNSDDAPGYDPDAGRRLQLLLPAYEAGLEQWHRLASSRPALASLIDTLAEPIVLFDVDGKEQHRNRALVDLLAAEPAADTLMRLAQHLASRPDPNTLAARRTIELEAGTYVLRLGESPLSELGPSGTLVMIERTSPYPPPPVLQTRFDLTPRESEVALLLARGLSNESLAERLFISPHTVRHHVQRVLRKLGITSRAAVADALLQSGE